MSKQGILANLKKVVFEFRWNDPRATSSLEMLAQLSNSKARAANPACVIAVTRRTDDVPPTIAITYNNDKEEKLDCTKLSAHEMCKRIRADSKMMQYEAEFREAGFSWPPPVPKELLSPQQEKAADARERAGTSKSQSVQR
ncbi:hypothetical protein KFL_000010650 [Klebsormidium nitens]|uniref:Large ribosomal subunit protein mL53 n=1 Tax=Klebsormidium nitens TaxID=105231 RepID=A0A0U9HLU0_KLENI|nr:hypothetical protein KFL_000010650 [Klebsormidium nitens]|eukprot:GAQ77616.1 hypothetical protein KFL_000010650 [Klebsormidium nitens]